MWPSSRGYQVDQAANEYQTVVHDNIYQQQLAVKEQYETAKNSDDVRSEEDVFCEKDAVTKNKLRRQKQILLEISTFDSFYFTDCDKYYAVCIFVVYLRSHYNVSVFEFISQQAHMSVAYEQIVFNMMDRIPVNCKKTY